MAIFRHENLEERSDLNSLMSAHCLLNGRAYSDGAGVTLRSSLRIAYLPEA